VASICIGKRILAIKPADLSMLRPTKFAAVINTNSAEAPGLTNLQLLRTIPKRRS
jgi:hypothetical protein